MPAYTLDEATTTSTVGGVTGPTLSAPDAETTDFVGSMDDTAIPHVDSPNTPASGIVIPGSFGRVRVEVVDPAGEPLDNVEWVMSASTFPTAARVDNNGEANLWLLGTTYSDFMAVASSGSIDLTWYSSTSQQPGINPLNQSTGTIVLEPVYVGGLNAGGGASIGL